MDTSLTIRNYSDYDKIYKVLTEDESASFISREGDLVKFWISFNECDILIERKGKRICINNK
ncbi:hypothetical protein GFS03_11920 [Sulfolobus sp. E5-1-F]|nr:hypothetical protein GFS03_11920 [Sulfolobus sp. E5-1-F]